jgi:predicted dehydrogenase
MSTSPLRWAILGPGRIAHNFARGFAALPSDLAVLHGAASRTPGRAASFLEAYGGGVAYDSYEAMLADPAVDAVYIATPHRFHYEQIKLCLEAGKPVLCEKPMTVNAREATELAALAKERGVFLMEALWTRYLPIFRTVRQWLDAGYIGELRTLHSTMGFACGRNPEDRWLNHALAGGALLDLGVYNVSCSQWAFGRDPENFVAKVEMGETRVDEHVSAILDFGGGAVSVFTCTLASHTRGEMVFGGTEGKIVIDPPFWVAQKATLHCNGQASEVVEQPFRASGFEYEIEAATRAIRAGLREEPTMPWSATIGNLKVMDAIRASVGFRYDFETF